MRAKLKFDLTEPEERRAHAQCVNANKMACFIWELQYNFWRKWEHDDSQFNLKTYREALSELLDEHNINIDELMN